MSKKVIVTGASRGIGKGIALALAREGYDLAISYASKAEAARYMIDHGVRGSIINITSSRGERAYPECGVYCGLKAGLNHAIRAFALDVSGYGIRVNNVAPGATRVRTKEELAARDPDDEGDYFWREAFSAPGNSIGQDFWDDLGGSIPLCRAGTPEDIGNACGLFGLRQGLLYHRYHSAGRWRSDPARNA